MEHDDQESSGLGWPHGVIFALAGATWVACLLALAFINQVWFMLTASPPEANPMLALVWLVLGPALPIAILIAGSFLYGFWRPLSEDHPRIGVAAVSGVVVLGLGVPLGGVLEPLGRIAAWLITVSLGAHIGLMSTACWTLGRQGDLAIRPKSTSSPTNPTWLDALAGMCAIGALAFFVHEGAQILFSTSSHWWSVDNEWLGGFIIVGPIVFFALFVTRSDALRALSPAFPAMAKSSTLAALLGGLGLVLYGVEPPPQPLLAMALLLWVYQVSFAVAVHTGPRN